jgi:hypothetical protein
MADGRVLKGPRPAQRKNAQFWNDVNSETENLVNQVHVIDNQAEVEAEEQLLTTLDKLAATTPESTTKVSDTVTEPVSAPSVTITELVSTTTETGIEAIAVIPDAGIEAVAVTPDVVIEAAEASTTVAETTDTTEVPATAEELPVPIRKSRTRSVKGDESKKKTPTTVLKPSQRGFKWPTP